MIAHPLVSLTLWLGQTTSAGQEAKEFDLCSIKGTTSGSMGCAAKQSARRLTSALTKRTLQDRQCWVTGAHARPPVCHKLNNDLPLFIQVKKYEASLPEMNRFTSVCFVLVYFYKRNLSETIASGQAYDASGSS